MPDSRPFDLEVKPGSVPNSTVITASGPLVIENLFRFQDAWRAEKSQILVFDFTDLIYMDSSAIGSLVNCHVHCSKTGKKMALAAVPDRVKQILAVTKVDTLFQFYPGVAEAVTALSKSLAAQA